MPKTAAHGSGSYGIAVSTGRPCFRFYLNGKAYPPVYQKKNEPDKVFQRRAEKKRKQWLAAAGLVEEMNVLELVTFFVDRVAVEEPTRDNYRHCLEAHIAALPRLPKLPANDLGPLLIESDYEWAMRNGRTAATIRQMHKVLSAAYSYGLRYELANRNPCEHVELPDHTVKTTEIFTPDELAKFLTVAKGDDLYLFFYVMLVTGARPNEAADLLVADLHFDEPIAVIGKGKARRRAYRIDIHGTKTKNADRSVIVAEHQRDRIMDHLGDRYDDKASRVVKPHHGDRVNIRSALRHNLTRLLEAAEVKKNITNKSFRHTSVYLARALDMDLATLRERYGWAEKMPEAYNHRDTLAQVRSFEKIAVLV